MLTTERPISNAAGDYIPGSARRGVALCLSGGGFRATLFHLGALRRLNELGVLHQIDAVTSVSGGSVTAAQLATAVIAIGGSLTRPFTAQEFDDLLARPLRAFTMRNIRTGPILSRLWPQNWFQDDTAVKGLEKQYAAHLTPRRLIELPRRPDFTFCSTDMAFGVNWQFSRDRVGDYQAGYMAPPTDMTIAHAVAASSCFPPVFNPLHLDVPPSSLEGGAYTAPDRDACIRNLRLTDGGDYDNLGLEPVWKGSATVLVSDGGSPFGRAGDSGLLSRVARYVDILSNQAHALRVRWLISNFVSRELVGTYWAIGGALSRYAGPASPGNVGYDLRFAASSIAMVRTDFDAFSDGEAGVLQNHGYSIADVAIRTHASGLITQDAPFAAPSPDFDWNHKSAAEAALFDSAHRKTLGR